MSQWMRERERDIEKVINDKECYCYEEEYLVNRYEGMWPVCICKCVLMISLWCDATEEVMDCWPDNGLRFHCQTFVLVWNFTWPSFSGYHLYVTAWWIQVVKSDENLRVEGVWLNRKSGGRTNKFYKKFPEWVDDANLYQFKG